MQFSFVRTVFAIGAFVLPLYAIGRSSQSMPLWQAAIVIYLVGLLAWVSFAYLSAIRKAHAAAIFARPVWYSRLLRAHGLRMILLIVPSLLTGVAVLVAILNQGIVAAHFVVLTAALVIVFAFVISKRTVKDFKPFAQGLVVIPISASISALIMTSLSISVSVASSIGDTVDVLTLFKTSSSYVGPSEAIAVLSDWATFLTGAQTLAEREATGRGISTWVILVWQFVLSFGYFFSVACACAATLISTSELQRIFNPTDRDQPIAMNQKSIAIFSAVLAILAILVVQSLAKIEAAFILVAQYDPMELQQPDITMRDLLEVDQVASDAIVTSRRPSPLSPAGMRQIVRAEAIGDLLCPDGTIAKIESMNGDFLATLVRQEDALRTGIQLGFAGMRSNVPGFMDWYYSLGAEFLRTVSLLIGSGSDYLNDQLQSKLAVGNPLSYLKVAIDMQAGNAILAEAFQDARRKTLSDCKQYLPSDTLQIEQVDSRSAQFLYSDIHLDAIAFQTRLGTSVFAGTSSGIIATVIGAKIGAKAVVKPVFTLAAKSVAKIAGGKALSIGSGALIGGGSGAAFGSLVPGAGTVVGGLVGGLVGGATVMLGMDLALLKLEEMVSRDAFEAEIILAIDEAERELLVSLGLASR